MSVAKFRSARLAANDLLSTYPKAQGGLETDIANAFGLTLDSDITASAFSFDNSGRVTKQLVEQSAVSEQANAGIGKQITNSSNSNVVQLMQASSATSHAFSVRDAGTPLPGSGTPQPTRFGIDMTTGGLTGWTTQDTVHNALIPVAGITPGTGSDERYYSAQGVFAAPQFQTLPFFGCRLLPVPVVNTSGGGINPTHWTETGGFDVGSFFDGSIDNTKINIPTTGKYLVSYSLAIIIQSPSDGYNCDSAINVNDAGTMQGHGNNIIASAGSATSPIPGGYTGTSMVLSLTAGDYIKIFFGNATGAQVTAGQDTGIISSTKTCPGYLIVFRIE